MLRTFVRDASEQRHIQRHSDALQRQGGSRAV